MREAAAGPRPYANICGWAVLECRDGETVSQHIVGCILTHDRLSVDGVNMGEPYISSDLARIDLGQRYAVNQRGKVIRLVGDRLPIDSADKLPAEIQKTLSRAKDAWGMTAPVWRLVEAER